MQITIPQSVGKTNAIKAHLILPVSFFIVINVVLQGKCNKTKIIVLIAVSMVQPFAFKISPILKVSSKFTKFPLFI